MFDFDAGKLIVIGIVALIAIPSKDLPRVLRTLGQATGRMRRMAAEFQGQLMDALREAEIADLKKEFDETNRNIMSSVKLDGAFDPLTEARKQITQAVEEGGKPHPEEPHSGVSKPHPEEPRSGVSKEAQGDAPPAASFETRPAVAPHAGASGAGIEVGGESEKKAAP
jgi:sec-independent protein translocase protein TatB